MEQAKTKCMPETPEGIAAHKILDFILQNETIKSLGLERITYVLKTIVKTLEKPTGSEGLTTKHPKVSKQARNAARQYVGRLIATALWVSPQEKKGLQAMGYNPDKLICIERFNDETVFLQMQFYGPVCLSRKDGGGRKDCCTPVAKNGLSIYEKEATRFMADLKK